MMSFDPGPGEPSFTGLSDVRRGDWIAALLRYLGDPADRPRLVAVDGRGGAGKSTIAGLIAAAVPGCSVVHTDDLAWNHSVFDWDDLLLDGVLAPLRRGHEVEFRPPAWVRLNRPGSIGVPAGQSLVVVEGTGVIRDSTIPWFDATIWVQADFAQAKARAIERDVAEGTNGDLAGALAFWDEWQQQERPFLIAQQPWNRADCVIVGALGGDGPHQSGPAGTILVAKPWPAQP